MNNNDKIYEKRARLYPVILSMLIPFILYIIIGNNILSSFDKLERIWNILISIIPASLVTAAIGYGVKNLVRSTSKAVFQFPLFKEDETNMPTTEFLLHSTGILSRQNKQLIRNKIKLNLGLELMDEEQERLNEREARLIIVDAVRRIREKTRGKQILFNYNCNYGFVRNFMGANVWSLLIVIVLMLFNIFMPIINIGITIGAAILIIISFPVAFYLLKLNGREYARQLFTVYMELEGSRIKEENIS